MPDLQASKALSATRAPALSTNSRFTKSAESNAMRTNPSVDAVLRRDVSVRDIARLDRR